MDTSDSDYFESADEELYSEDNKFRSKTKETHVAVEKRTVDIKESDTSNITNENIVNEGLVNILNVHDNVNKNIEEHVQVGNPNKEKTKTDIEKVSNNNLQLTNSLISTNTQKDIVVNMSNKINEGKDSSSSEESQSEPTQKVKQLEKSTTGNLDTEFEKKVCVTTNETNSDNEENNWDNDEWEPILEEQESPFSAGQKNNQISHNEAVHKEVNFADKCENKGNPKSITEPEETENMWENDDWEPIENEIVSDSYPKENKQPEMSWQDWGNWGVSSILNTATQGVSTVTKQVSQGISTVLETSIGIPDPKELARQHKIEEELAKQSEFENRKPHSGFGFGNLSNFVSGVSHITKFVENTGSKVITGGLDTLETIGKKTMEVLQEGDPGFKNKRALLKLDKEKPILSQILREAKEKSERENQESKEIHSKNKLNYESLFDDYHGLVHLEALEMLSKQCDIKLQTLSENSTGSELEDLQETMDQIKELCDLPDEDDDETPTFDDIKEKIQIAVKDINVKISYEKLISHWEEAENWLNETDFNFCDESDVHQEAIQNLAQLTAISVEQFHKCGELLLIKEHRSTADEADSLVQLTMALTSLIGLAAGKFCEKLNTISLQNGNKEFINELITNVFFEAGNSSSYIQDALQLLVPVLQIGALQ